MVCDVGILAGEMTPDKQLNFKTLIFPGDSLLILEHSRGPYIKLNKREDAFKCFHAKSEQFVWLHTGMMTAHFFEHCRVVSHE